MKETIYILMALLGLVGGYFVVTDQILPPQEGTTIVTPTMDPTSSALAEMRTESRCTWAVARSQVSSECSLGRNQIELMQDLGMSEDQFRALMPSFEEPTTTMSLGEPEEAEENSYLRGVLNETVESITVKFPAQTGYEEHEVPPGMLLQMPPINSDKATIIAHVAGKRITKRTAELRSSTDWWRIRKP